MSIPPSARWKLRSAELLAELAANPSGLSSNEAEARLKRYGTNALIATHKLSALRLFIGQVKSPLVLLLVFAAGVSLLSRSEIDALYVEAAAVAYPSRYEGFGLPVLEALGAGTAVVAADTASMPEVLGDAGQLIDPDDPAAWATALARVLDHDPTVADMVDRGLKRAEDSSWDKLVPMLVDVYRRTVSRANGGAR